MASQNAQVILPLLALRCQERDEASILSQVIQIGVFLEHRVAWESVISRRLQPLNYLLRFIHERISTGDLIGRVVEVTKPLSLFYSRLYLLLRQSFLPG